jgi:hypothetical protein
MRLTRTLYIGGKLDAHDMVHAVTTVLSVSICRHDTLSDHLAKASRFNRDAEALV